MMKIPNIFSHDNLPPLFSDKFREIGPEWKRLTGIDFERVGRILTCHLIIEHYLTNYIELQSPNEFDWSEARLTFSQKLKLAKKTSGLKEASIFKGIESSGFGAWKFSVDVKFIGLADVQT